MLSLIILLPLFASIIVGISYKYNLVKFSQGVTIISVGISMILTIKLLSSGQITYQEYLFDWIKIGNLEVKWEFFADKLILMMMFIITIISLSVHIYSISYMDHDDTIPRFMSYLSLFTFFMLMLVTSANLLQLFFGWEGVGLCSYLLIGYWYKKNSANKAAMKAFLVNRVADIFFVTSLVMIYNIFETLDFALIFQKFANKDLGKYIIFNHEFEKIDLICISLLIGAMGKSAQLGLHVWLPDAMEGPTPISALIHAATMVTAGIFLIARFSPIFQYSSIACDLMLVIGALTCLFGAMVAIGQNDVKKVIAYSTCSQLGYMFMACGAKAYNMAMFHLITHAFFKALLFLCAGSVIYATHHQQDIRKMGNLWVKLPVTYIFMIIGTIAITGIYPFAGHYSKDAIIEILYLSNQKYTNFAYISSMITVFLTAIYSMRIICKIFHGPSYFSEKEQEEIKEPPSFMAFPLYILAIASICAGSILKEKFFIHKAIFWRDSLIMDHVTNIRLEKIPENIAILPLIVTISGFLFIIIDHFTKYKLTKYIDNILPIIFLTVRNKFYFDQIYKIIFVNFHKILSKFSADIFDSTIINKIIVNNFGKYFPFLSRRISIIQSGYIYHYVTIMILFTIMILSYIIFLKVVK